MEKVDVSIVISILSLIISLIVGYFAYFRRGKLYYSIPPKILIRTEEKYFILFNYELKDEHTRLHLQLKEQLMGLMKEYEIKGRDMLPALLDFLEDWLVVHLNDEDKKYVKCFKEHGL